MKLGCVRRYISGAGEWQVGDVLDVDDEFGAWLMRDDPLAFKPIVKEVAKPPEDKAVKAPPRSKARGRRTK